MTDNLYNTPAFTRYMKRILPHLKYTGCRFLLNFRDSSYKKLKRSML